jgi:hypothetical protein
LACLALKKLFRNVPFFGFGIPPSSKGTSRYNAPPLTLSGFAMYFFVCLFFNYFGEFAGRLADEFGQGVLLVLA